MPDHRTHRKICCALLGEAYPDVDSFLDEPYRWRDSRGRMLKGRHRKYRHDGLAPAVVFARELVKSGDAEKALKKAIAALIHITADQLL